ncbi:MAG: restriction endonuclease subunit S [Endomicrobia bacterium]|nr:restriction endonuclease subunit S [Endomicrobiia bacterium]MCL2507256.1 restriction endonuclease subunit S [Endomicrobiia bacterium]
MTKPIDLRDDYFKILKTILTEHLEGLNARVYTFGSRAKWTAKDTADIDLALDVKNIPQKLIRNLTDAFEESNIPYKVDIVDLNAIDDSFRNNIKNDLVEILYDWEYLQLSEVAYYGTDKTFVGDVMRNSYVSTDNMLPNKQGVFIAESMPKSGKVCVYKKEDILVSNIRPYFKKIWLANIDGTCSADVLVFKTNKIDKKLLYYILSNDVFFDYTMQGSKGTKMPRGDKDQIMLYPISFPYYADEQKKIADVLGSLDDKIELLQKQNKTLEGLAKAIFKSWFVDFEPFGGIIPDNWRSGKLSEILDTIESGSRPKGGAENFGIPSIGAENIEGIGIYDYTKEKYVNEDYFNSLKKGKVKSGDVLLYKDGAYTGKVSMSLGDFPHKVCAVNEHVFILRVNEQLSSQFFLYLFLAQDNIKEITSTLASAKAAQPGLNQADVNSVPLIIPDIASIIKFNNIVSPLMYAIVANATQARTIASIRDYLLPKLISGKVRVQ